jgi:hypothetical protein
LGICRGSSEVDLATAGSHPLEPVQLTDPTVVEVDGDAAGLALAQELGDQLEG